MLGIDLHLHSVHSDGELTPEEIVSKAKELAVAAISLTDHDCTDGVPAALAAGIHEGVEVVPGVELSVRHGQYEQVHLLGYYVDPRNKELEGHLTELRDSRLGRGKRLVERVNEQLIVEGRPTIDFAEVEALARKVVGRPHIAKIMTERGLTEDMLTAFRDYLVPLNIQKNKLTFEEAVNVVKHSGGVPVLAHPNLITRDRQEEIRLLDEFTRMGLQGLEGYYHKMSPADTEHYRVLALERGLILTGGSDFHGFNSYGEFGRVQGGRIVPAELLTSLKATYFKNRTILVVLCHDPGTDCQNLVSFLVRLTGAAHIGAEQIHKACFPWTRASDVESTSANKAVNRIFSLECELKLMRGESVLASSSQLDPESCTNLMSMADRSNVDVAFLVGPASEKTLAGLEAPLVRLGGEGRKNEDGALLNTLSTLLHFTLERLNTMEAKVTANPASR